MARRADSIDQRFAHFCRTGDPAALGEVFDRTAAELLHVAVWLVGNRADAEDALQRTFLQAIEARARFEPGRRVMPWLMGLLANQAKLVRRERERRAPARPPAAAQDPRDAAVAAELQAVVHKVQQELGTPYREVLTLHLEEGLNAKEIAARLGRPAGTVRTQLVRALERLRKRLPAGFVAGFAPSSVDAAAMAATRAAVVQAAKTAGSAAAAGGGAAAAAAAVTGGIVMSKKTLLAGTALALLVGLLVYQFAWEAPEPAPFPGPPDASRIEARLARTVNEEDDATTPDAAPERTAARIPETAPPAALATLEVRLRWADTGEPAVGQGLKVYAHDTRFRIGRTGADGTYTAPELAPGTWKVKPALGPERIEVELSPGETRTLEAEIARTGRIVGRVLDEHGAPVPGAGVWLSYGTSSQSEDYEAGRTDVAGRFEAFTRGKHRIGARCPGHAPSLQRLVVVESGSTAEVELRLRGEGGAVRGRIVDGEDKPVAWAHVLVGGEARGSRATAERWGEQRGWDMNTDVEGRFFAESVAPGTVDVQAWADGFGPVAMVCEVRAGSTTDVVLELPDGAVLTGSVRNEHGEAVEDVWISTGGIPPSGFGLCEAVSAADGSFRLENLRAGKTSVMLHRPPLHLDVEVELVAGEETVWNPVLSEKWAIAGTVVGTDGAPVDGVYVSCAPESGRRSGLVRAYPTGEDGRFAMPNNDSRPQRVAVTDRTHRLLVEARNVPAGTRDLLLRIPATEEPSARVHGRVVDEAGTPVAAEIRVQELGMFELSTVKLDTPDGSWQTELLVPGRYQVHVIPGGLGGIHALPAFDLAPDEDRDLGDIVVLRPGRAVFRVFDTGGKPVTADARCDVWIKGADAASLASATLESGSVEVSPLPPGPCLVTAYTRSEVAFGEVDVPSAGVVDCDLHLKPRTDLRIQFDCGEHPPPQHALFEVYGQDGALVYRFRGAFADLMPRRELRGYCDLPPGRWNIVCTAEGGLHGSLDVTATADGGRLELTMPLRK